MAGYRALAAVGRSVVTLLNRRFADEIPADERRPEAVLIGSADLDRVNTAGAVIQFPAVSVFCYRISVDAQTRPGWSGVAHVDGVPRIPLRMHLMVTAWDEFVEQEMEWLGLTARVLESEPVLTGPLLDPTGAWLPGDAVQVVPDCMALESMSETFQALTADFRLYLLYEARVIVIDGRTEGTGERVTTVAGGLEAP